MMEKRVGRILFTSDTHFGHANVIKYCKRPFLKDPGLGWVDGNLDVEAMDNAIVSRWNEVVGPGDHVFHLGDVAMGPDLATRVTALRKRLNGSITLIRGNHDRSATFNRRCGFEEVWWRWEGTINGVRVLMAHHPPERALVEHGQYDLILCGHVHNAWKRKGKVVNVGVDVWDFAPVSLDRLCDSL